MSPDLPKWSSLYLFLMALLLAACPTKRVRGVSIARQVHMPLLPAATLGRSLQASQVFRATFRGKTQTLFFQVEVEPGRVAMVGLTPLGVRLFSLQLRGNKVMYEPQPFFKAPLQPKHMLADFQLAYWPIKVLQQTLKGTGVTLVEPAASQGKLRLLKRGEKVLVRIAYSQPGTRWRGDVQFRHIERGYHFVIRTKQVQEIPPPKR